MPSRPAATVDGAIAEAARREWRMTMSRDPIGVVIADDRQMVREGFRAILDSQPDISVVGEAGTGAEAVRICQLLRPRVCLLDIRMPEMDGLEATRQLQNMGERAPAVVIVTTFDLDEYVFEAFRNGARGFITKDTGAACCSRPSARLPVATRWSRPTSPGALSSK